jgi:hypothetical protein
MCVRPELPTRSVEWTTCVCRQGMYTRRAVLAVRVRGGGRARLLVLGLLSPGLLAGVAADGRKSICLVWR